MSARRYDLVVLGLSLSSSWGNGHATTYRALLKALAERGHDILFLERDCPWYAKNRDLARPPFCKLALYDSVASLSRFTNEIAEARAVIVGSYVADGAHVCRGVLNAARGVTAFYDIDTPVTLAALDGGTCAYLDRDDVARFDFYFSFTGGPTLKRLERQYGARHARALYCSVDPDHYRPVAGASRRWDLGYLGTYSADRQPLLEQLLIEPARRAPDRAFVVAGPQYPESIAWPTNVERIEHIEPSRHAEFYSSLGWSLNLTRADMRESGWSPSVRLFEAAACASPLVSDAWAGLDAFFLPDRDVLIAEGADDVLCALALPEARRKRVAEAGRRRALGEHTARGRAAELEAHLWGEPARIARFSRRAERSASEPQAGGLAVAQRRS